MCKFCDLYGICGAHTAGCVKDPDEGCPFYRYFKKIFQPTTKNDLGVTKAIEILRADNIASYSVEDVLSARDMAIKALEQEPKWIPVSERLPEETIKVLVQSEDVYYNIGENSHGIIIGWRNGQYWSTYTVKGIELIKYPVAWMPLPEAYKAESEE